MSLSQLESCRHEALKRESCPSVWRWETIRSPQAMCEILQAVAAEMAALHFPDNDVFALRLGLEEALANAFKHGDPTKPVRLGYCVAETHVLAKVEDEGPGFDPHQVPDPLAPENLERSTGRGLLLMHYYLSWLRYNQRGNCVTLCKVRSDS